METCHVKMVKPGITVETPTLEQLGRMIEKELANAAARQSEALDEAKCAAIEEVTTLMAIRKSESERLIGVLATLKSYKALLTKQAEASPISGAVWAALDAVHDQYLAESEANDHILAQVEEAKARQIAIDESLVVLHASPGWQLHVAHRELAMKKATERAAAEAIIAANTKTPDAGTDIFEQVAAVLAELPEEPIMVEVPVEKEITRTQRRKANKAAPKVDEDVEPVVPQRRQKRQSAAAVAELVGAEGLDARMVARITKRQQQVA
jgi:hypothetical protein